MLRTGVILLSITVLIFAGVKMWYGRLVDQLTPPGQESSKPAAAKPAGPPGGPSKGVDYQVIIDRNIFDAVLDRNVAVETEEEEKVETENLEETKLQLVLMGTVSGSERDARAIVVDQKANKQDIYQIGDALQGAFITSIDRGKVVLEVNGRNEVLTIKDREGGGPEAPDMGGGPDVAPDVGSFEQDIPQPVQVARPQRRVSFRQTATENPQEQEMQAQEMEVEEPPPAEDIPEPETMPDAQPEVEGVPVN